MKGDKMKPIGYTVLFNLPDRGSWEPSALTDIDEPEPSRLLLERTCFSMFPTAGDAESAIRETMTQCPGAKGAMFRVCAVFPANVAAPHEVTQ